MDTTVAPLASIGVDIGKEVFHLVGFGTDGKIAFRRKIKRLALIETFRKLSPCIVGMEACLSAHFVSRALRKLGHEPRIIPAIYVKPFVKGQKNDYNDAEAIAEAALRPNLRAGVTALRNSLFNILRNREDEISPRMSELIVGLYEDWLWLEERIETITKEIEEISQREGSGVRPERVALCVVFDKSNRTDGTFSRSDFVFDAEQDRYSCPAGKQLVQFHRTYATPRSGITKEGTRLYRASKRDCDGCALKPRCCPNAPARKIPRDLNEDARDVARALADTQPMNAPAIDARRWRCCSPTSSASSGWVVFGCEDRAALATSSCLQPLLRTSESWLSSGRWQCLHRPCKHPERPSPIRCTAGRCAPGAKRLAIAD
jgi:hypothetical protein